MKHLVKHGVKHLVKHGVKHSDSDRYLEDFATLAVCFCFTVAVGLFIVTGILWWVWEV